MSEKLICSECSSPIAATDEHVVIKAGKKGEQDTLFCSTCVNKIQSAIGEETRNPNLAFALVVGAAAAVVAGGIWYLFTTLTGWEIGILAVLVGWLTAQGVIWGAGHKRGPILQLMAVVLTAGTMFLSEYLIFNHFFHDAGGVGNLTISQFIEVYGDYFTEGGGFLDALFFGIALWQAFATPARRTLQGEFVRGPGAS